jgi:uncharacterized membrane protein
MRLPEAWQLRLIQLLSVGGIMLAHYLLLFHEGKLFLTCEPGIWDCSDVSGPGAPYSSVGPIPVALIGLAGYVAIFAAVWLRAWLPKLNDYMPELMLGLTGLAFLFSLGLTALEAFVIHAFCYYCVVSAVIVTVMFGLSISYLRAVSR